jgi:ubiquinone/menaquinone biosynthesis C-methylase UbiE
MPKQHSFNSDFKTSSTVRGFIEEIRNAARHGPGSFFNWFDVAADDVDSTFVKGHCEFAFYFLSPLIGLLPDMKTRTAVEIGYGGGRLLAAAAPFFRSVIGIDIHDTSELVRDQLAKRGIRNVELLQSDGRNIPLADNSVHLVYSFIVLQHVATVAAFTGYLTEAWRVLADGGYAILFFGRFSILSRNTCSKMLYGIDQCIESLFPRYRETSASINQTNLRVSLPYAVRHARRQGFKVIRTGASRKLPDVDTYGGQSFLVLVK